MSNTKGNYTGCTELAECVNSLKAIAQTWHNEFHENLNINGNYPLRGKPLWITETGWLGACKGGGESEMARDFMAPWLNWLKSTENPGYDAVAWFGTKFTIDWCTYLIGADGNPQNSALGAQWNAIATP